MIRPPVFNEKEVKVNSSGPRQFNRNVIVLCLHLTELSIINRTEYNGLLCLHWSRYLLIMSHPQLAETFFIPSSTCHKIYQIASSVQYWCFHPFLPSSFSLKKTTTFAAMFYIYFLQGHSLQKRETTGRFLF